MKPQDLAIRAILAKLDGVRANRGWIQAPDRTLVEVTDEVPARVRCRGCEDLLVASEADLPALDPIIEAARVLKGRLTLYRFRKGRSYRVIQDFADFYNNRFTTGELLEFEEQHFLPYEGGHTLVFRTRSMWVADDTELAPDIDLYLEEVVG